MKFLLVNAFYPVYLAHYYRHHLISSNADSSTIVADLLDDQFSACHDWAREFSRRGWDARYWIANLRPAVDAHRRERGVPPCRDADDENETLAAWIDEFRPEVLFLGDPIRFDARFLARLKWRPPIVAAWRAAFTPPDVDWHGIDILFSHLTVCREDALRRGVKRTEFFHPGFPTEVAPSVLHIQPECDVVFTGQWTAQHAGRNALLQGLAFAADTSRPDLDIRFHLESHATQLPPQVEKRNHGAKWALQMLRTLRTGRICLNAEIDMASGEAGNMRLFEATGVGAFLLTQHQRNIERYFVAGKEIETYHNIEEMLEKITWYLGHPVERETIARAGLKACQERFSSSLRAEAMERILLEALTRKMSIFSAASNAVATSMAPSPVPPGELLAPRAEILLREAEVRFAAKDIRGAIELCQAAENLLPGSAEIINATAWLKSQAGDLPGAQVEYMKVTLLFPNDPASHANFAAILMKRELYERAEQALSVVLRLDPRHIEALLACARLRRDAGRTSESTSLWRRFLSEAPFDHPARNEAESTIRDLLQDEPASRNRSRGIELNGFDPARATTETDKICKELVSSLDRVRLDPCDTSQVHRIQASLFQLRRKPSIADPSPPDSGLSHSGPTTGPDGAVRLESIFPNVGFGSHVQILGAKETGIGGGSIVGDGSWLNVCSRDGRKRLRIGRCVCVGRRNVISTAGDLEIGDYCLFAPHVYVADSDHIFSDPFRPYLVQGQTTDRKLTIEENCWIGFGAIVTGGLTIGRGSVVGANAVVNTDVEPFCVVVGTPARVVKMYDPLTQSWTSIGSAEDASRVHEHRAQCPLPDREAYRQMLWNSGMREITPLVAGGDRTL